MYCIVHNISSTQTLTVMIRNIASKKINKTNLFKIIGKETFTGLINGMGIGLVGGIGVYIWKQDITLAFVFFTTLVFILFMGGFMASVVPLVLNKLK